MTSKNITLSKEDSYLQRIAGIIKNNPKIIIPALAGILLVGLSFASIFTFHTLEFYGVTTGMPIQEAVRYGLGGLGALLILKTAHRLITFRTQEDIRTEIGSLLPEIFPGGIPPLSDTLSPRVTKECDTEKLKKALEIYHEYNSRKMYLPPTEADLMTLQYTAELANKMRRASQNASETQSC